MGDDTNRANSGHALMKYGMWACCVVMFLSVAGYFLAGGTEGGLTGKIAAFAPLLLCVGAHFVMFKMMGKSCHGASDNASTAEKRIADARRGGTVRAVE